MLSGCPSRRRSSTRASALKRHAELAGVDHAALFEHFHRLSRCSRIRLLVDAGNKFGKARIVG
jgi:hypothetical protein